MDVMKMAKVALLQSDKMMVSEIKTAEIKVLVREAVRLAGGFDFIEDGQLVVLKPNLISTRAITGQIGPIMMTMPFKMPIKGRTSWFPKRQTALHPTTGLPRNWLK